jgi:hypothetical protein
MPEIWQSLHNTLIDGRVWQIILFAKKFRTLNFSEQMLIAVSVSNLSQLRYLFTYKIKSRQSYIPSATNIIYVQPRKSIISSIICLQVSIDLGKE